MATPSIDMLGKLESLLDADFARLKLHKKLGIMQPETKTDLRDPRFGDFFKYLVSVVTHPIALRASVSPFNCSQEDMLAYILDMFSITDTKLAKLYPGYETAATSPEAGLIGSKKRHSWRPQLRLRINPPAFFYKQHSYITNLSIRVYLFKEEKAKDPEASPIKAENGQSKESVSGILNHIFKRRRQLSSSQLIRPVSGMKRLVRFEALRHAVPSGNANPPISHFKMVQSINESSALSREDIYLNIRRYYCEPDSVHIVRFEFWLNSSPKSAGCLQSCRLLARRIVFNGPCSCCGNRHSTYMNENQEFYGYINIRLTQLPSYATRMMYPIISLKGRPVNYCELTCDIINRRIPEQFEEIALVRGQQSLAQGQDLPNALLEDFLINHLRIYASCFLYQCLELKMQSLNFDLRGITIDNLFYVPAFSLINQHRLQSNILQSDDKCLRRVALIALIIKLDRQREAKKSASRQSLNKMMIALLYISINEYMVENRSIDDKTMQDVNPFKENFISSPSRSIVQSLESCVLTKFVHSFLTDRLKRWLVKDVDRPAAKSERTMTLLGLRLCKVAITSTKRLLNKQASSPSTKEIIDMRGTIDQILSDVVFKHLQARIAAILDQEFSGSPRLARRTTSSSPSPGNSPDSWLEILYDIEYLNHDLKMHWSRMGIDALMTGGATLDVASLEKKGLNELIANKLNAYLK